MSYIPSPINTANVELDNELLELIDILARNTHEVWSMQKLKDGWKYGTELSYTEKTHPCLIPYEELHENEKIYDINTSSQVVKVILSLGYKIEK